MTAPIRIRNLQATTSLYGLYSPHSSLHILHNHLIPQASLILPDFSPRAIEITQELQQLRPLYSPPSRVQPRKVQHLLQRRQFREIPQRHRDTNRPSIVVQIIDACPAGSALNYCKTDINLDERCGQGNSLDIDFSGYLGLTGRAYDPVSCCHSPPFLLVFYSYCELPNLISLLPECRLNSRGADNGSQSNLNHTPFLPMFPLDRSC